MSKIGEMSDKAYKHWKSAKSSTKRVASKMLRKLKYGLSGGKYGEGRSEKDKKALEKAIREETDPDRKANLERMLRQYK